jgi:hypothetical protein
MTFGRSGCGCSWSTEPSLSLISPSIASSEAATSCGYKSMMFARAAGFATAPRSFRKRQAGRSSSRSLSRPAPRSAIAKGDGSQVRSGLAGGGRGIRTLGPPATGSASGRARRDHGASAKPGMAACSVASSASDFLHPGAPFTWTKPGLELRDRGSATQTSCGIPLCLLGNVRDLSGG